VTGRSRVAISKSSAVLALRTNLPTIVELRDPAQLGSNLQKQRSFCAAYKTYNVDKMHKIDKTRNTDNAGI
jgi:hypothetical protein